MVRIAAFPLLLSMLLLSSAQGHGQTAPQSTDGTQSAPTTPQQQPNAASSQVPQQSSAPNAEPAKPPKKTKGTLFNLTIPSKNESHNENAPNANRYSVILEGSPNTNPSAANLVFDPTDYSCAGETPFGALPDTIRYSDPLADLEMHHLFHRSRVSGDYFFLLYDAQRNKAAWYDYRDALVLTNGVALPPHEIHVSGHDFLPVVYSREKIAVHVCNLRISDSLTVTMSPTPLPENGADFRGVGTSTAVALAAATDTVLSSGASGVAATPGSSGYSSSAALSVAAAAGYTAGVTVPGKAAADPPSYTDATITIAPKQLADLTQLVIHDSDSVRRDVLQFRWGLSHAAPLGEPLPGSIDRVNTEANALLAALPAIPINNPGMFNRLVDETSALAGEVNALGTALGSTSLGARAETIRTNFAALQGIVKLANSLEDADGVMNGAAAGGTPCDGSKPDAASCRYYEEITFHNFLRDYCAEIGYPDDAVTNAHQPECLNYGEANANAAVNSVDDLRHDLAHLDLTVGRIFRRMNDWYDSSRVDETDILTPAGTNAVERINVLIHRTYVPFTIVGSSQISSSASGGGGAGSGAAAGAGGSPAGGGAGGGGTGAGAGGTGAGAASTGGSSGGGAAGAVAAASTTGTSTSAAGGSSVVSNAAFTAETFLMEVHRRANFNVVGGAVAIRIPTENYTVVPEIATLTTNPNAATAGQPAYIYPAPCNSTPIADATNLPITPPTGTNPWPATQPYYCIAKQQSTNWQAAGMVGVGWFPFGRDYFPYGTGGSVFRRTNYSPSLMAATSVTSLGNFFVGPDVEPSNGINFFAGVAAGHQNTLPSGVSLNFPLLPVGASNSPPTLPSATHEKWGISLGVAFDVGVFAQIFGKASGATAP